MRQNVTRGIRLHKLPSNSVLRLIASWGLCAVAFGFSVQALAQDGPRSSQRACSSYFSDGGPGSRNERMVPFIQEPLREAIDRTRRERMEALEASRQITQHPIPASYAAFVRLAEAARGASPETIQLRYSEADAAIGTDWSLMRNAIHGTLHFVEAIHFREFLEFLQQPSNPHIPPREVVEMGLVRLKLAARVRLRLGPTQQMALRRVLLLDARERGLHALVRMVGDLEQKGPEIGLPNPLTYANAKAELDRLEAAAIEAHGPRFPRLSFDYLSANRADLMIAAGVPSTMPSAVQAVLVDRAKLPMGDENSSLLTVVEAQGMARLLFDPGVRARSILPRPLSYGSFLIEAFATGDEIERQSIGGAIYRARALRNLVTLAQTVATAQELGWTSLWDELGQAGLDLASGRGPIAPSRPVPPEPLSAVILPLARPIAPQPSAAP